MAISQSGDVSHYIACTLKYTLKEILLHLQDITFTVEPGEMDRGTGRTQRGWEIHHC